MDQRDSSQHDVKRRSPGSEEHHAGCGEQRGIGMGTEEHHAGCGEHSGMGTGDVEEHYAGCGEQRGIGMGTEEHHAGCGEHHDAGTSGHQLACCQHHAPASGERHASCHHSDSGSYHSCVSIVPIFNHLDDEQMREIAKAVRSVIYRKQELIYRAGDQSDALYIVRRGRVKIYRLSESGKEQIYRILSAGDFTGELALFNETTHESYAEAIEETEICVLTRDELQHFLIRYPAIALKIMSELSSRLEETEVQTVRLATERADTRIALFLADCADANVDTMEFTLPMSKKDLASYLGTTPETISRKFKEFEEAGYIQQLDHRTIRILDLDGLLLI